MLEFNIEKSKRAGSWLKGPGPEPFYNFMPSPLPPNPAIRYEELGDIMERANRSLGRLDEISVFLPDPDLFLYTYIRKEAVLSSQIEGTQSSLSDLLLFEMKEMEGLPLADVKEVSNYVAATLHGLSRIQEGFPLSLRLIKEIHGILLQGTRGADKEPGEFRRTQNWIGGTRPGNAKYVPPPEHEILAMMGALEKFLHNDPVSTPTLLKAGLAHAQFESIHPFLDGNGRVGRLLITLILCSEKALSRPLLYLSLHFKRKRDEYYALMQKIRTDGDWESWLKFYFEAVDAVATEACETARRLVNMFDEHKRSIQTLKRAAFSPLRIHGILKKRVFLSPAFAKKELGLSFPAVNKALVNLTKFGFVREITGKKSHRLYVYEPYLKVLSDGSA